MSQINILLLFLYPLFEVIEKFLFQGVSGMRFSFSDIILVSIGFYTIYFIRNVKIYLFLLFITISFILSQLSNNFSLFNTAIISIPCRFLYCLCLFNSFIIQKNYSFKILILNTFILIFTFLLLFFSDAYFQIYPFLNRNEISSYIALFLILYILTSQTKFTLIILCFFLILTLFSFSRQFILSIFTSILLLILFNLRIITKNKIKFLTIIFLLFSVFSLFYTSLDDYNIRRYSMDFNNSTNSDIKRYNNILFGIHGFLNKPILGNGVGSYIKNHPENIVSHNGYISLLYENGLFGFLIYFVLFLVLILIIYKARNLLLLKYYFLITMLVLSLCFQCFFTGLVSKPFFFIIIPFIFYHRLISLKFRSKLC